MTTISASEARARVYRLLDETAESGEPIQITERPPGLINPWGG